MLSEGSPTEWKHALLHVHDERRRERGREARLKDTQNLQGPGGLNTGLQPVLHTSHG